MKQAAFLSPLVDVRRDAHDISQSAFRSTRCSPLVGSLRQSRDVRLSAGLDGFGLTQLAEAQEPAAVYDAVLPSTETLLGMGFVIVLCAACAWYWNEKVVPVSRTNLAISKSRGEVKEYLDELRATDPKTQQPANSTLAFSNETIMEGEVEQIDSRNSDDRALERWLFTDWLIDNKSEKKAGRQKEPALPILKSAKWNSGDNPVVVAAFLMIVGLMFTAFTERISSAF